jgi:hypothetical protein
VLFNLVFLERNAKITKKVEIGFRVLCFEFRVVSVCVG